MIFTPYVGKLNLYLKHGNHFFIFIIVILIKPERLECHLYGQLISHSSLFLHHVSNAPITPHEEETRTE